MLLHRLGLDCGGIMSASDGAIKRATHLQLDTGAIMDTVWKHIETFVFELLSLDLISYSDTLCPFLRDEFGFGTMPRSDEEARFPLAYGILAHAQFVQVVNGALQA